MRSVSKRFSASVVAALLACTLLSGNALAAERAGRDPSFVTHVRLWMKKIVRAFGDGLIVPPA